MKRKTKLLFLLLIIVTQIFGQSKTKYLSTGIGMSLIPEIYTPNVEGVKPILFNISYSQELYKSLSMELGSGLGYYLLFDKYDYNNNIIFTYFKLGANLGYSFDLPKKFALNAKLGYSFQRIYLVSAPLDKYNQYILSNKDYAKFSQIGNRLWLPTFGLQPVYKGNKMDLGLGFEFSLDFRNRINQSIFYYNVSYAFKF